MDIVVNRLLCNLFIVSLARIMISDVNGRTLKSLSSTQSTISRMMESSYDGLELRGIGDNTRRDVHSTTLKVVPWNSHSKGELPNHQANSKHPRLQTSVLQMRRKQRNNYSIRTENRVDCLFADQTAQVRDKKLYNTVPINPRHSAPRNFKTSR